MASCTSCRNGILARVAGERNPCRACNATIYGGEGSALRCILCKSYFHEYCLQNTRPPVTFTLFAGDTGRQTITLALVTEPNQPAACQACGDTMRGSSRYTTPNRHITVHPSCAVDFVPRQNANNLQVPEKLRAFLTAEHRRNDFNDMVIQLYSVRPRNVANCMLCDIVDAADWWYVMTRNGQRGGCHVGCLKTRIAINRSNNRIVDLERYYDSINGPINARRIQTAQKLLELVIGVALPPPLSNVLIFVLQIMAAAVI